MIEFLIQYPYISTILTFLIGALLMPSIVKFAKRHNLVVRPNKRTSHTGSVPNIGGANIFLSLLVIFIGLLATNSISISFFVGFCVVFIIGFVDDRLVLSAYWKLLGETLGAFCIIYFADVRIDSLHGLFGLYELPLWASYIISYFVYVLIINALNLVDGVDGLASSLAIIYSLFFGLWFLLVGENYLAMICFASVGVLLIFFIYNVFGGIDKKIFMGDSGSLTIGYLISFIVFSFIQKSSNMPADAWMNFPYSPATAIIVLFVPIFDVFRVSLTRLKKGKSIFEADRNHIHHLLLRLGLSHRGVTFILDVATLFFIALAILLKDYNFWVQVPIVLLISCLLILIIWQLINNQEHKNEKI